MFNTSWSIAPSTQIQIASYFLPFYIANTILSTILNAVIIIVTIRSKEFRNVSNILIAVQAAGDLFITWDIPYLAYNTLKKRFVPMSTCFFFQLIPTLAMNTTTVTMLMIGVDRYLLITHSKWYISLNKKLYLSILFFIGSTYIFVVMCGNYLTRTEDDVLCFITDAMAGRGKDAWAFTQCLINIAVIVVYSRAKMALQKQRLVKDTDAKKIFKSVYLIMVFYMCGWMTSIMLLLPARILITDIHLTGIVELGLALFAATNLLVPFFVYYFQSPMYKREIRKLLRLRIDRRVGAGGSIFSLRSPNPTGSNYRVYTNPHA
ncbi:hypothetical protein QR680_006271 [Steinernema hermaphroditum]|uniref:G-protein coupled receptors family 1 profile domain-containing protein n=1 Tax=Steinernema hermaphroditum TaxID=289476 RepID=A0AA39HX75_9BILA|nr:hypothetical protein QR680_006271 [Steinernema hermaphroditum]